MQTRINGPVAVIGDVHGQADKLLAVLDGLRQLPDYENRWIVFIGDFVDRGPDPKAALDIVTDMLLQHPKTTAIAGNHELAMSASLGLVPVPDWSDWSDRWTDHYQAETTFESYDARFGELDELKSRLPESHERFLADLPWCVEHPEYFFVHAGLDPNASFDMQLRILRARDFSLTRPQWLCSKTLPEADVPHDCPATVISGHVYVPSVQFRSRKLLIDTTGGTQGELSCVLLPEMQVISSGASQPGLVDALDRSWWKFW